MPTRVPVHCRKTFDVEPKAHFLSFSEAAEYFSKRIGCSVEDAGWEIRSALLRCADIGVFRFWRGEPTEIKSGELRSDCSDFNAATEWFNDVRVVCFQTASDSLAVIAADALCLAKKLGMIAYNQSIDGTVSLCVDEEISAERLARYGLTEGDSLDRAVEILCDSATIAKYLSDKMMNAAVAESKGQRLLGSSFAEVSFEITRFVDELCNRRKCSIDARRIVVVEALLPLLKKYMAGYRFSVFDLEKAMGLRHSSQKLGRPFEYNLPALLIHLYVKQPETGWSGTWGQLCQQSRDYFNRPDGGPSDGWLRANVGPLWDKMVEERRKDPSLGRQR